jgi:hypothetical protein
MTAVGNDSARMASSASPFVFMYKNHDDGFAPCDVT